MVAIARGMALALTLLLLDEAFEGLAPAVVKRFRDGVLKIEDPGISLPIAQSHLINAARIADRLYAIDRGDEDRRKLRGFRRVECPHEESGRMVYRKQKDSDTWHFCSNCSKWPSTYYDEQYKEPPLGELCNECRAKAADGSCQKEFRISASACLQR